MTRTLVLAVTAVVLAAGCGKSHSSPPTTGTAPTVVTATSRTTEAVAADLQHGGFPAPETPVKGGRLKAATIEDIDTWNGLSGFSWELFSFMARGLYGYPNDVSEPNASTIRAELAEDLPTISDDGLTYTVRLRSGLRFPDGHPVTAADVKATFEYMLDPSLAPSSGGPASSGYYDIIEGVDEFKKSVTDSKDPATSTITGITAVNELTTVFHLMRADGSFLRALAMPWGFIRPASTPHRITATPPPFVGPYEISSYASGRLLTVDRDPGWAGNVAAGVPEDPAENNIDGVDLEFGVTADSQLLQVEANQLDLPYDAPGGSDVPAVANDPQYAGRFFSTPDAAVYYGVFRSDRPPFNDVRLRQAVNLAVDRALIVKMWGGELATTAWSQVLPRSLLGNEPIDVYPASPDVEAAKRLIAATGLATPIKVTFAHLTAPEDTAVAVAAKGALTEVGFDVELKAFSLQVYFAYLADPKADYHLAIAGWGQDYPDAITFFGPLLSCPGGTPTGSNHGRFCDPAFDAELATINQLAPGPERTARFARLSTETMRTAAPMWPLANPRHLALISERVGNYRWNTTKRLILASLFLRQP